MPEIKEPKQSQRKFFLACYFAAAGTVCLFLTKLNGGEFITLAALILGLYAGANVAEKTLLGIFGNKNSKGEIAQ